MSTDKEHLEDTIFPIIALHTKCTKADVKAYSSKPIADLGNGADSLDLFAIVSDTAEALEIHLTRIDTEGLTPDRLVIAAQTALDTRPQERVTTTAAEKTIGGRG